MNYKEILNAVRATRKISLPAWGNIEVKEYKSTSSHDAVTEIDTQIESYLCEKFALIDPTINFVGEEYGGDRTSSKYWIVDPIDGTGLFVRGLVGCSTMGALVENGIVVFSFIYDFVHDVMYHAIRTQGAFKDGEPIHVSDRTLMRSYMGYESDLRKEGKKEKLDQCLGQFNRIQYMSAGYEYALVAEGKIDGRVVYGAFGNDYDFAPGTLLVKEAGGVVTNIGHTDYALSMADHIAANPIVHAELTQREDSLFPSKDA